MRRHETPSSVASALARHAPRQVKRILDPAVGNGVLLEPFFRQPRQREIFAVDTDSRPLRRVEIELGSASGNKLKIFQANFLEWACDYWKLRRSPFDCIVMNPPFAARNHKWVSLAGLAEIIGPYAVPRAGPIEAGFILGAVALLKPAGRLLAILPASLVTAPRLGWVREFMAAHGAIRHVHELPRFTFPKIESRIYLVVYEKGRQHDKTRLLNHDLQKPEKMLIVAKGETSRRLDFAYYSSNLKLNALRKCQTLGWRSLNELAKVWRGTAQTPGISRSVVHTGNYRGGFWQLPGVNGLGVGNVLEGTVQQGDILVKRVSRNCARSFGVTDGIHKAHASDCVLIIRPRNNVSTVRLLFALRCLMALAFGPALLEKGTGASYLAQGELDRFEIPFALSRQYPKYFRLYTSAVRRRCFASMRRIEAEVGRRLASF